MKLTKLSGINASPEAISFFCTPPPPPGEKSGKSGEPSFGAKGFFGYSFLSSSLPAATLAEIGDQEGFSAAEFTFSQLEAFTPSQWKKISSLYGKILAGAFVSGDFAAALLQESSPGRLESFAGELEKEFRKLAAFGVKELSFDLPFQEILAKGECPERRNLQKLFRKLLPVLAELDQTLLLPCRIPFLSPEAGPEKISAFLRESMCPHVKLALEVYPHELPRNADLFALAGLLGFDAGSLVFDYDADKGETLVRGHVFPWAEYLCSYGFRGAVLVSPRSRDGRFAMTEGMRFSGIVSEIRKNPHGEEKEKK